jgi:hypothetical protein
MESVKPKLERKQHYLYDTVWYEGHWWSVKSMVNYWLTLERTERRGILGKTTITKKVRPTKVF